MNNRLSLATLDALPNTVHRPAYDPAAIGVGIVHLGIGAFHRAHQAVYADDAIAAGGGDWRIQGVSLRSAGVRDQLVPQDGLFTLVVRDGDRIEDRVIGSVAGVLVAPEDPAAVINAIAAPGTHIVSLTVTEKGYCHDPATGALNRDHPDIVHDLAHPDAPRSAIGFIVAGLARRHVEGAGPLTCMSCDNLPHNGAVLRGAVTTLAAMRDPALADWIAATCTFPATMVDRIVPATTDADIAELALRTGVEDRAMVKAEPFSQWVIEDAFAAGRPPYERHGARLVGDVRPFEFAKLRMLNGAHSTLAYLGLGRGLTFVHESMADPATRATVEAQMAEAAATVGEVPGLDVAAYADALRARFANSALEHRLAQIAMDGSQKLPQRLVGTMADRHAAGATSPACAMGVAAWIAHLSGPFLNDPLADRLRDAGTSAGPVAAALAIEPVFGSLGDEPWFADQVRSAWDAMQR
ncbi:mannitol dehydrogenase family protein [Sphingomonas sp. CJ99]